MVLGAMVLLNLIIVLTKRDYLAIRRIGSFITLEAMYIQYYIPPMYIRDIWLDYTGSHDLKSRP